jgi:hypothetical protein
VGSSHLCYQSDTPSSLLAPNKNGLCGPLQTLWIGFTKKSFISFHSIFTFPGKILTHLSPSLLLFRKRREEGRIWLLCPWAQRENSPLS